MPAPNPILGSVNERLQVTNLYGGGVAVIDSLNGLPLGTDGDSATGTIGVKCIIVGGSFSVTANTAATASASAPSYSAGSNPLSQTLTGDLRTIAKIATGQTIGIDQTTPGVTNAVQDVSGFAIPQYDNYVIAYLGSTNNIDTIIYKVGATPVATLTFTYVGGGVADDDLIQTVTKT